MARKPEPSTLAVEAVTEGGGARRAIPKPRKCQHTVLRFVDLLMKPQAQGSRAVARASRSLAKLSRPRYDGHGLPRAKEISAGTSYEDNPGQGSLEY